MNLYRLFAMIGIVSLIAYFFPIVELMLQFLQICIIPMIFLASVGIVSKETLKGFSTFGPRWREDLKRSIERHRRNT